MKWELREVNDVTIYNSVDNDLYKIVEKLIKSVKKGDYEKWRNKVITKDEETIYLIDVWEVDTNNFDKKDDNIKFVITEIPYSGYFLSRFILTIFVDSNGDINEK